MNKYLLLLLFAGQCTSISAQNKEVNWAVVGAGPAGIAAVGTLLDAGISNKQLVWIDPEFDVGRLGKYYCNVPGNSVASTYHYFVQQCSSFAEVTTPAMEQLLATDPDSEPLLGVVVEPLRDITKHLIEHKKVPTLADYLTQLHQNEDGSWRITVQSGTNVRAHNVVLATGCQPRTLDYPVHNTITLDKAWINKNLLVA